MFHSGTSISFGIVPSSATVDKKIRTPGTILSFFSRPSTVAAINVETVWMKSMPFAHMKTPNVTKLISGFKALTSRSKRAPSIFKEHFKMSPISPSETRMDDAYFSCFPSCSFLYFLFHSFRVSLFFLLLFLVSLFYRWWSEWELAEQLWKLFDGLPAFFS